VGFAIGSPELITDLWAVKDICNLGRLPLAAATAALGDGDHMRQCVETVVANRERLSGELAGRGWDVLPSGANFVFAVPPSPAADLYQNLLERRILVRYFDRPSVGNGLRISVGAWDQCAALLDVLDQMSV
jgi:histidinol-phosphate aminotransferase